MICYQEVEMTIYELFKICDNCSPNTKIELYFGNSDSGIPAFSGNMLSCIGMYTNVCKTEPIKSFCVCDERFDIIEVVI